MNYLWAILFGYLSKFIVAAIIPITGLTYPFKSILDSVGLRKISVQIVVIIATAINIYAFLLAISTCISFFKYYIDISWIHILLSVVFFIQYILLANRIVRANQTTNASIQSFAFEMQQTVFGIAVLVGFILFNLYPNILSPLFSWPFDLLQSILP